MWQSYLAMYQFQTRSSYIRMYKCDNYTLLCLTIIRCYDWQLYIAMFDNYTLLQHTQNTLWKHRNTSDNHTLWHTHLCIWHVHQRSSSSSKAPPATRTCSRCASVCTHVWGHTLNFIRKLLTPQGRYALYVRMCVNVAPVVYKLWVLGLGLNPTVANTADFFHFF